MGLPLHFAAKSGSVDAVRFLVEDAKLGVNAMDNAGKLPLSYAVLGNHIEVVEYLLSKGAEVNGQGMTPLMIAGSWGHVELIELLVARGAKPDLQTGDLENMTALHIDVEANRHVAAAVLLQLGADAKVKREDGKTALDMAEGGWLEEYWERARARRTLRTRVRSHARTCTRTGT